MNESAAWIVQVKSDFATAEKLFDETQTSLYCQVIAKYQQVVEKSVNAMVAALNEVSGPVINIGTKHYPEKQINALLLMKFGNQDLVRHVHTIFSEYRLGEIRALCLLAPSLPPRRNTEYSYPDGRGGWTAPAAAGNFRVEEVYRFRTLVNELVPMAGRFIQSALFSPNNK